VKVLRRKSGIGVVLGDEFVLLEQLAESYKQTKKRALHAVPKAATPTPGSLIDTGQWYLEQAAELAAKEGKHFDMDYVLSGVKRMRGAL
jgi:hypothetical protein